MSGYCPNCGNKLEENAKFCPKCGKSLEENKQEESKKEEFVTNTNTSSEKVYIEKRSIPLAILLSLVTCGIYNLVWFVQITNDAKKVSDSDCASGGLALVYSLITCGIYSIYWAYKMGKNMHEAGLKHNKQIEDQSILYLILSVFGLGIVNHCLIQNDLNSFAE